MASQQEQMFGLAVALAQMTPEQRLANTQGSMPPQMLLQLEQMAQAIGQELNGGSVASLLGGMDDEDEQQEEAGSGGVTLMDVASLSWEKAWQYAGTIAFWAGVPLLLYVIKERRGMSWGQVAQAIARLPFSD